MNTIELYRSSNGETQIEVRFEDETVWLSLNQIAELFGRDKSVISRHLKNIYKESELNYSSTAAKNATVQTEGKRNITREIDYYNLDAIISVGYRVNSKQGTQFRIWATNRLKEYLIKGYSINQKRLQELNQIVQFIAQSENNTNKISETKGLLNILTKYAKSFILLNQFDSNAIELKNLDENITYEIDYNEAVISINELKNQLIEQKEATELFGNQKDQNFEGILKSVTQTFDGNYLYPTIEEQAANLLYFIIKNHPFSDGNKRIGAFIFVWFLEKNKHLLKNNGENKINDNALIALALLVAQSNPNEKELMIKLICNLIIT
ncbi:MAG: virulence protein RhuM/Fic/DOC family protein [Bacteroidia bacterium]|nr:virulence protein RhuM/Fic/DOC family protein [Bacteroidia bacterium]MBP7715332.1 virulence protein RhuM/Fic/DOC family protein [Bacteroidia bacterium]MBP8668988.1 virulence protein RhuM/Fic/DOC family protein [Bacteroidia bacterium]HQW18188.1 virulence protein RhuM/Fic/DOC family protein [Bacteroidia bacterium]HQW49505.1 virulence protein RhuM/Fic/DOC family protein [Bacteroidia bacterium]